jgi:hypothetical protein
MADDGEGFEFNVWNIYPQVRQYDRPWSVDAVSMLNIIEQSCFWLFLDWTYQGRWPSIADATVKYPQRIDATHVPLKIHGRLVAQQPDYFDKTYVYDVRSEAAPDSEPLFTAEIRWQALEMAGLEGAVAHLAGSDQFRSSTGTLS